MSKELIIAKFIAGSVVWVVCAAIYCMIYNIPPFPIAVFVVLGPLMIPLVGSVLALLYWLFFVWHD